jgi:hypothetical protein
MKLYGVDLTIKVNPLDCKAGKSRGVVFRTGAHVTKKNNAKHDRREWKRNRREDI